MRHLKKVNHLSRTSSHRHAMLANMAISLIMHKRISTTVAKAKALRTFVEPLVNRSKTDSTHHRRVVFSTLQNKEAVTELFREISVKVGDRPGGYTRILKTGNRLGDNAEMCIIELVDYNENLLNAKETKSGAKTSRRRRATGKKKDTPVAEAKVEKAKVTKVAAPVAEVAEEEPVVAEVAPQVEDVVEITPDASETEAPVAEATSEEEPKTE